MLECLKPNLRHRCCTGLTSLLLLTLLAFGCARRPEEARKGKRDHKPAPVTPAPPEAPAGAALAAHTPDPEWVAKAREEMQSGGRVGRCGDYLLFTDVTDSGLLAACERLATNLDATFTARYGVKPFGRPGEAIFLFAQIKNYRAFAAKDRRMGVGYAGFTSGIRGFTALYAGDQKPQAVVSTLAHELAHLVSRRALGPSLAPWLSEGLADGIGDTATEAGFGPLEGFVGVEAQAKRLAGAYRDSRASSLARLVALKRGKFDRDVVSFDYEQSALALRFFLLDPELRPRFQKFLRALAAGEFYDPHGLRLALSQPWAELDARFKAWLLGAPLPSG